MNQKVKWTLFTIIGTLANFILVVALFLLLTALSKLILGDNTDPVVIRTFFLAVLMLSLFGSFGLYALILRWVDKKWNLEEKLGRNLWGKRRN